MAVFSHLLQDCAKAFIEIMGMNKYYSTFATPCHEKMCSSSDKLATYCDVIKDFMVECHSLMGEKFTPDDRDRVLSVMNEVGCRKYDLMN